MDKVKVSVVCVTYNHEKYIEKCIKSLLEQETDFLYEIIIHDDASTDNTARIVEKYAELYPDKIVTILQKENVTQKGKAILRDYIFPIAKGKYIACCEGDDYWCCKSKLQKQYEAIEKNPNCGMVLHATQCVNEEGKEIARIFPEVQFESGIISTQDIIDELPKWLFHYSSYFYEKEMYLRMMNEQQEFFEMFPVGDIRYLYLFILYSDIYYYSDIMSCYRTQAIGSWTTRLSKDKEKKFCEQMIIVTQKYVTLMNQMKKGISMSSFKENAIDYYEFRFHVLNRDYDCLIKKKFKKYFREFSTKYKIKIRLLAFYRVVCKMLGRKREK